MSVSSCPLLLLHLYEASTHIVICPSDFDQIRTSLSDYTLREKTLELLIPPLSTKVCVSHKFPSTIFIEVKHSP